MPAHVGIPSNKTADRLAKAAAKLSQPHLSTLYKEVKTLLKQKQKSVWRLRNNGHDPQKDQINTLDRKTHATIFRLRADHCGPRKHLKRDCVSLIQPTVNVALRSKLLSTFFRPAHTWSQFWPEDTKGGTKLWGHAAELQRTADFLAAPGLRI